MSRPDLPGPPGPRWARAADKFVERNGDPAMVTTARTRREEYAAATNAALLESAAACFFENGFAATSLDEVARRARVTKGAIYHHFASKRDLFMAVLERQQEMGAGLIMEAGALAPDPWSALVSAFDTFLDIISEPHYQRLCWVE